MERPQGKESTEETQETNGCGGQMHLPLILKLCLVLIHTLKGDKAGVGRNWSPPYTILCGFIFFLCVCVCVVSVTVNHSLKMLHGMF